MAEQRQADERAHEPAETPPRLKRRGLIAAAAALAAGVLARQAAQPVEAAYNLQGDASNTATALTTITGTVSANPVLRVKNNYSATLDAAADGVQGYAVGASIAGVHGRNNDASGIGVYGVSTSGAGVEGVSTSSIGVYGVSTNAWGVYGSGGLYGVYGVVWGGSGAAVIGVSSTNSSHGVQGSVGAGVTGHAVVGTGATANYAGVLGQTATAGAFGVYGFSSNTSAYAGYFSGKVTVAGDFNVTGSKSAVVPHPDGSHRAVYCMEAPEAWFEDFGEAAVVNGGAEVALDPDFAAIVDTTRMHVFLTAQYAEGQGLAVTKRTARGFRITERNGGTSSGACCWRVVARRKDNPGARLAKVTLPKPLAKVPDVPVSTLAVPKPRLP